MTTVAAPIRASVSTAGFGSSVRRRRLPVGDQERVDEVGVALLVDGDVAGVDGEFILEHVQSIGYRSLPTASSAYWTHRSVSISSAAARNCKSRRHRR